MTLFATRRPPERVLRQFAAICLVILTLLVARLVTRDAGVSPGWLVVGIAGWLLSLAGVIRPSIMGPIWTAWLVLTHPIAWAISHVVLAVVYFLVVSPLGLLMRAFRRAPLRRRFDPGRQSYWIRRDERGEPERYLRQF